MLSQQTNIQEIENIVLSEINFPLPKLDNIYIIEVADVINILSKYNILFTKILINDIPLPISGNITFTELPVIKAIHTKDKLSHYISKENGQKIDIIEFDIISKERKIQYLDQNGRYKDLDSEYMYRKFIEKYSAVYVKEEIEVASFKFEVYNVLNIKDDYIIPVWRYGQETNKSTLVKFEKFKFIEDTLKLKLNEIKMKNQIMILFHILIQIIFTLVHIIIHNLAKNQLTKLKY